MALTKGMAIGYDLLYKTARVHDSKKDEVQEAVDLMLKNQERYREVARTVGMPWEIPACIHEMEFDQDFSRCLHNGQRWDRVTTKVPKGVGPFNSWYESSVDAMTTLNKRMKSAIKDWDGIWTVPVALYSFEMHNGFGFRKRGINSPYLWSYTQHYTKGKYVEKRYWCFGWKYRSVWKPNMVSEQCGVASYLKLLEFANKKTIEETKITACKHFGMNIDQLKGVCGSIDSSVCEKCKNFEIIYEK